MEQHEIIDVDELRTRDAYRLMTDLIAPRPIAWVSSLDGSGTGNLAPFSFFQGVSANPPTIMLGVSWKRDGTPKDTLRNILERREFTVSHVGEQHAQSMNATSGEYPAGLDEWTIADGGKPLPCIPAARVAPPRVAGAHASLECRMVHALPLGRGPTGGPSTTLVLAEVLCFTVCADLLRRNEAGHLLPIDPARLASIGRLGGIAYTRMDPFEMPRPKVGS